MYLRGVAIRIETGDITKQRVDAIVNPANSQMFMGSGVAGAIKRVGGAEIEAEALKKAPIAVGSAIVTKAGRLPAKFVIHTPTMNSPAMRVDGESVALAMKGALQCAQRLKNSESSTSWLRYRCRRSANENGSRHHDAAAERIYRKI